MHKHASTIGYNCELTDYIIGIGNEKQVIISNWNGPEKKCSASLK